MLITCLTVSHQKPEYIAHTITSVANQTHAIQHLVIDSGILHKQGFFRSYPQVEVIRSDETALIRRRAAIASYCLNLAIPRIRGDVVAFCMDDDVLLPSFSETVTQHYRAFPDMEASYYSQSHGAIVNGGYKQQGIRKAIPRKPGEYDCHVDGMQLVHRVSLISDLVRLYGEYWPTDKATAWHADGILLERIARITTIEPLDVVLSCNRKTALSTFRKC